MRSVLLALHLRARLMAAALACLALYAAASGAPGQTGPEPPRRAPTQPEEAAAEIATQLAASDRTARLSAVDTLMTLRPDLLPAAERLRAIAGSKPRFLSASEASPLRASPRDPAAAIERLAAADALTRAAAIAELGEMGADAAEALERLFALIDDTDAGVRAALARALPKIRWDARVLGALRTLLKDADASVRRAATFGLARDAAASVTALRGAAQDPDASVRHAAIVNLGRCRAAGRAAESDLVATLRDRDRQVRAAAIGAIGRLRLHSARTLAELDRFLDDPDTGEAWAALEALGRIGEKASPSFGRVMAISREAGVRAATRARALEVLWAVAPGDLRGKAALRMIEAMSETDGTCAAAAEALLRDWIVPVQGG